MRVVAVDQLQRLTPFNKREWIPAPKATDDNEVLNFEKKKMKHFETNVLQVTKRLSTMTTLCIMTFYTTSTIVNYFSGGSAFVELHKPSLLSGSAFTELSLIGNLHQALFTLHPA